MVDQKISADPAAINLSDMHFPAIQGGGNVKVPSALVQAAVIDRAVLKAIIPSTGMTVYITEPGREGVFAWRSGDYAARVASDTLEGIYVEATAIAATSGAWVRATRGQEPVNLRWFGPVANGVTDDKAVFDAAAAQAAAIGGEVFVPRGNYAVSAATSFAVWMLGSGAIISGLPNVGGIGYTFNDISRLTGRVFSYSGNTDIGARFGGTNAWAETYRPYSIGISEVSIISSTGQIALLAATRTSDNPTTNYAAIGGEFLMVHDNTVNFDTGWAVYMESVKVAGSMGPIYCVEMDTVNLDTVVDLHPGSTVAGQEHSVPLWIANGAEVVGAKAATAAAAILNNGAAFRRGILVFDGALDATYNEFLATPAGTFASWYSGGSLLGHLSHFIADWRHDDNSSSHETLIKRRRASSAATQSLDIVEDMKFYGYTGSVDYLLGQITSRQRSAFSSGNARGSIDVTAHNDDATSSQVSLNGLANKMFGPFPDNSIAMGSTSFRWTQLFAATATIGTSDARLKTDVTDIPDAVINAFWALRPRLFRWLDAVEEKGENARIHSGYIAQEWEQALTDAGLDPRRYAVFCADPLTELVDEEYWAEKQETDVIDEPGFTEEVKDGQVVRTPTTVAREVPLFDRLPLVDENGTPILRPDRPQHVKKDKDTGEEVIVPFRAGGPEYREVPRMKRVAATRKVERPVLNPAGEPVLRYGLRYELIIAIMDAAYRRRIEVIENIIKKDASSH